MPIIDLIGSELESYFPYPFNEEIKGISKELNANIGDIVLFQILYDLTANANRRKQNWCTGILTSQKDGRVIHGRNFDYDFPLILQKLVYTAEFYRNGSLLFTSAQFAGSIGIATGHKHNAFTFSVNERNVGPWWYNIFYGLLDKQSAPISFLTRELMENATSYNEAVDLMSKTDLIAPAYFLLAGIEPHEMSIVTRNQTGVVDTWKLDPSSTDFDSWFLIETNYDHWEQPPKSDDRRDPGIQAMQKISQARISDKSLMDVLTIQPVCNKETAYSVVMSAKLEAKSGGYQIIVH